MATTSSNSHSHPVKVGSKTYQSGSIGHQHTVPDQFTSEEVTALKAILAAGGGGGTTPVTNPPQTPPPDITAPVISNVQITGITETAATVSWSLSEAGNGQVAYGASPSLGSLTSLESSYLTAHSQTITGLTAGVTYHVQIRSADAAGNLALSSIRTFTTNSPTPPPPEPPPPPASGAYPPNTTLSSFMGTPAMARPAYGGPAVLYPALGTKVRRISNTHLHRNWYPTQASFSKDNDRLIFFPVYGNRIIRTSDWTDLGAMSGGVDACQWSKVTNMKLWGVHEGNPPEVRTHNGQVGSSWTTHRTFTGYTWGSLGLGDGNLADDDKMSIVLRKADGTYRVIGYNPTTDAILGWVDVATQPTASQISLDGTKLFVSRDGVGEFLYTLPGSDTAATAMSGGSYGAGGLLTTGVSHSVMAKKTDGTNVWVTYAGGLYIHTLSNNARTRLLPGTNAFSDAYGGHVAYSVPGWVTLSSAVGHPGVPGNDQIVMASLDNPGTVRIFAFGHNTATKGLGVSTAYDASPFAISNNDGTVVCWGSAWDGSETSQVYAFVAGMGVT